MTYRFKWKVNYLWHTRTVIGHRYDEKQDKMVLYLPDGGLEEIAHWRDCSAKLGPDWVAVTKKDMETKAGQSIPLNV